MMLLAATLTFTACGDDDDDNPNGGGQQQQQGQNEVNQDNYYMYQESINLKNFGTMTCIGEATFDKGQCTVMALSYVYPKKSYAQSEWEDYQDDEDFDATGYYYDGDKTITYRFANETVAAYSTMGKDYICSTLKKAVQDFISSVREAVGEK
jgi:hypothetical protein